MMVLFVSTINGVQIVDNALEAIKQVWSYLNLTDPFRKNFSHLKWHKPAKVMELCSQCITDLPNNLSSLWSRNLDTLAMTLWFMSTLIGVKFWNQISWWTEKFLAMLPSPRN